MHIFHLCWASDAFVTRQVPGPLVDEEEHLTNTAHMLMVELSDLFKSSGIRNLERSFERFLRTYCKRGIGEVLYFEVHYVGADSILFVLVPGLKGKVQEREEEDYCHGVGKISFTGHYLQHEFAGLKFLT